MSKPRIIAGSAKNRALETPKRGTRPSPARLREAVFNILEFEPRGTFLDLFSGSGAMGLEAASRGWQSICVDISQEAVTVIRKNARALKLTSEIVKADALQYLKTAHADVLFAAPPYDAELLPIYDALLASDTAPLMILQHPSDFDLIVPPLGREVNKRRYGFNAITMVRRSE
jgi:16S rRNA (guanine(966)-N(2))-methyltransferase RsmD